MNDTPSISKNSAATDSEKEEIRIFYSRSNNARTFMQQCSIKKSDLHDRLFEYILVAWGRTPHASEIEFTLCMDNRGRILAVAEGLRLYVIHSLEGAKQDIDKTLDMEERT